MPKVTQLSHIPLKVIACVPGPALFWNLGGLEGRCAGQPMACGWPLWASVSPSALALISQACIFGSEVWDRVRTGTVKKRERGIATVPGTVGAHLGGHICGHCLRASSGCRSMRPKRETLANREVGSGAEIWLPRP